MRPLLSYADPFWGCDTVKLPQPEGLAATWYPIKAMLGANDPGAAIPFGKFTCSPYTGGYSSGYGNRNITCGGPVGDLEPEMRFRGVTHIHNDGTGFLGLFYNYLRTVPYSTETAPEYRLFANETAVPGRYDCTLSDGIGCSLTVGEKGAVHRYTFPAGHGNVLIDASQNGLLPEKTRGYSSRSALRRVNDNTAVAEIVMHGVTLFAAVRCTGAECCSLFAADKTFDADTWQSRETKDPFGFVFTVPSNTCEVTVTITAKDEATALAELDTLPNFDAVYAAAHARWEEAFSKVDITGTDYQKTVFASAYYHSLLKPTDWSGEGFWGINGDCIIDLCTLWDMNKTQLPLVFTLFPETGRKLMHTFCSVYEKKHLFPNTLILASDVTVEVKQARALTEFVIADAYFRGLCDASVASKLLDAAAGDIFRSANEDFVSGNRCEYATHMVDLAEACHSMAIVAEECGETALAVKFAAHADRWKDAFSAEGLMREDSPYYEGTRWNYSFRLQHDMEARIALCGREAFEAYLDRFFGFTHQKDVSARFEGFNNETDMETPYAYHYIGRHDRISEIMEAQNRFCYAPGRHGAPGNVDSGSMSSCYVWNCLGVFPVSGQNKMLLGTPAFNRAALTLPNGSLTIEKQGNGRYVKEVTFNGVPVPTRELTVREFMRGGSLVFTMTETV